MSNHYRPLPDCLTIKESPIHGLGLFATKDIKIGTNLGITHYIYIEGSKDIKFPIRLPLGGFFNHNGENPNCDIKAGEELTAKYTLYNPEE
jgi:hypothetical protein